MGGVASALESCHAGTSLETVQRQLLPCTTAGGDFATAACCMTAQEWRQAPPTLFQPCMVCSLRPASIVEIPCGHITVCNECYVDYQTNARCLRCRDKVSARVDIAQFLDDLGRPEDCYMCKKSPACVVTVPCVHMCLCSSCLPQRPVGCPTCGALVEQTCTVKWNLEQRPMGPASSRRVLDNGGSSGVVGAPPPGAPQSLLLDGATEGIDAEILRLESQLLRLRTLAHTPQSASGSEVGRPVSPGSSSSILTRPA